MKVEVVKDPNKEKVEELKAELERIKKMLADQVLDDMKSKNYL